MLRSDASLLDAYPSRLVTKGDEYEGLQFLFWGDPLPKIWRFAVLRLIMNRRQQWRSSILRCNVGWSCPYDQLQFALRNQQGRPCDGHSRASRVSHDPLRGG